MAAAVVAAMTTKAKTKNKIRFTKGGVTGGGVAFLRIASWHFDERKKVLNFPYANEGK